MWDGTRVLSVPSFTWGGRVANSPPNNIGPFGNFILDTRMSNINVSVTKLHGAHTFKFGYYYFNSNQRRGTGNFLGADQLPERHQQPGRHAATRSPTRRWACSILRPDDAVGGRACTSRTTTSGTRRTTGRWRRGLTLDYGVRLVHQEPQYDGYFNNSTFLPEQLGRGRGAAHLRRRAAPRP